MKPSIDSPWQKKTIPQKPLLRLLLEKIKGDKVKSSPQTIPNLGAMLFIQILKT